MAGWIRSLTWISLCGMSGFNEFRFTRDRKKKAGSFLIGILWGFLIVLMTGYAAGISYGLVCVDMGRLVPAVLALGVSMIVFVFTMMKAGPVLFDKNAYERQIVLPVNARAILVSRFLSMYLVNMVWGMLIMAAGMAVYGVMEKPGLSFYLCGIAGSLFLPLLPLTAASVVGALIAGISSRWKRKNMASILLTMFFVCVILIGSFRMPQADESRMTALLQDMAVLLEGEIGRVYPPAIWLSEAMTGGNAGRMILFFGVSFGCFAVFMTVLEPFYGKICSLLGTREAKGNCRMTGLSVSPVRKSMVTRELRHYFSSTVYVTNTLVGEVMMVALAAAVLVAGKESIEHFIAVPGLAERALPILLGMLPAMMPMTACSISIEGKQWWVMQTLPVTEKEVIKSKVWANLLVVFPFYLVSEALLVIALRPDAAQLFWLLAVPAVYILFCVRLGVAVNQRFPVFDWDNETRVVKQSVSAFLMVMAGMLTGVIPMIVLMGFPEIPVGVVYAVFVFVLAVLTLAFDFRKKK